MKKAIIALALAGIAASASAFYDANGNWIADGGGYIYEALPGVTVIGNPIPPGNNLCAPFACQFPAVPPSGGGTTGSASGGPGGTPPPPPPTPTPIKPPPPDKATCVNDCALDRKIRDNSCASESRSLKNKRENQALAVERMKLPYFILKMMLLEGTLPDIPGTVQAEIDREVASFDKFCAAIAGEAENACLNNCTQKFGWFLPMLLLSRRRKEENEAS